MGSGKETNSYIEILNIQLSAGELLDIYFFSGGKKQTFVGTFPFSLTCLSCNYHFSLIKPELVSNPDGQWFKYKDLHILLPKSPITGSPCVTLEAQPCHPGLRDLHPPRCRLPFSHVALVVMTVPTDAGTTASPTCQEARAGGQSTSASCASLAGQDHLPQSPGFLWAWPELLNGPALSGRRLGVSIWYRRPRDPQVTGASHQEP